MKHAATAVLCKVLIVLMAWMPFQAQAGMIGSDAASGQNGSGARALLAAILDRADVASKLGSAGVSREAALERVNAMSDAEACALARDMESAPAGGLSGYGMLFLLIIAIFAVNWWAAEREKPASK